MDELKSLSERMKRLKAELSSLDERNSSGSSANIAYYNSKVDAHNGLLARHRSLFSANSVDLQTLEDLEKQDSTLVNQYNALLKR